jgi:hypothetical protein
MNNLDKIHQREQIVEVKTALEIKDIQNTGSVETRKQPLE